MNLLSEIDRKTTRKLGWSYKLHPGHEINQFGLDLTSYEPFKINKSDMSVVIPFADGNRVDGVGDLIEIEGIDTSRHELNPVVLFDHGKQVTLPIGKAEDKNKNYTVTKNLLNKKALVTAYFYQGNKSISKNKQQDYDHSLFCEQLFHMIAEGYIRAGSIGYQVLDARKVPSSYGPGKKDGMHLLKTLMLEASAVVIPANQDTVLKMLSMPKVCGKKLSPYLIKSLSPYVSDKKTLSYLSEGSGGALVKPAKQNKGVGPDSKTEQTIVNSSAVAGGAELPRKTRYKRRKALADVKTKYGMMPTADADNGTQVKEEKRAGIKTKYGASKPMAKSLSIKVKGLEDDEDLELDFDDNEDQDINNDVNVEDITNDAGIDAPDDMGDESPEAYSSQVLRRIHEDLNILMEDYDEMADLTEEPDVKMFIVETIKELITKLEHAEGVHNKVHGHLKRPIGPGMGLPDYLNKQDVMAEDGSDEEELGEEEEGLGEEEEGLGEEEEDLGSEELDEEPVQEEAIGADSKPAKNPKAKDALKGMQRTKSLKAKYKTKNADGMQGEDGILEEFEVNHLKDAMNFCNGLFSCQDFSDDHKHEAYHHYRNLQSMAKQAAAKLDFEEGEGKKSMVGDEQWAKEEAKEPEHQEKTKGLHKHRSAAGNISHFFKLLSQEKTFGEPHRQSAKQCAESINEIVKCYGKDMGQEAAPETMPEGDVKSLYDSVSSQEDKINELKELLAKFKNI